MVETRQYLLGFCALLGTCAAIEAQAEEPRMVYQSIKADFEPVNSVLLLERQVGQVLQIDAEVVPAASHRLLIGGLLPPVVTGLKAADTHATFFIASRDAAFAATPVQQLTQNKEQQKSRAELEQESAQLQEEVKVLRVQVLDVEDQLGALRLEASKIAQVDEIINRTMKIEAAERDISQMNEELLRLQQLAKQGRELEEPEDVDALRQKLATDLEEAAKITATADRLNRRRSDAAKQTFMRKVALVKEMQDGDPQALAREVLKVRQKRRELENRLGVSISDTEQF